LYVSLDGVDCRIREPTEFSPKWWSHKINGPGLRYEIGLNMQTGDIVWVYGGLPCGQYSDLRLARECYVRAVGEGELTLADDTYKDRRFFIYPSAFPDTVASQKAFMTRHETVNRRLKKGRLIWTLSNPHHG